jgi:hypothetical protein
MKLSLLKGGVTNKPGNTAKFGREKIMFPARPLNWA